MITLPHKYYRRRPLCRSHNLLIVIIVFIVVMAALFYGQLGAVDSDGQETLFIVENGATPIQIAARLESEGFIKNAKAMLYYTRLTGKAKEFKAGQYMLSPSLNTPQIVNIITRGKVATVSFTIPEGYNLRQIAELFVNKGLTTEEDFWREVKEGEFDYFFLEGLPHDERRLEGYLFPDTYNIPKGSSIHQIIYVMLRRFNQVYQSLPPNLTDLDMTEVVTLASIVEGESMLDKERPLIASVFLNRLKIDMKLDSCATIQYLFEKRRDKVLLKDLEIESPYNTYRNRGLPPGPIGSPGEASLRAILQPADTNYLYFVAKKDGSHEHVFATTLTEHNQNKRSLGY